MMLHLIDTYFYFYLLSTYLEDGWETEGSRGLLHFNQQNCEGRPKNSVNCRRDRCYNYNFMRFSISSACYQDIKFHLLRFSFCSYSCLFEAGYDIMEPGGASSTGPWGYAAKSNVADCMTYLDSKSKCQCPVALLSTMYYIQMF